MPAINRFRKKDRVEFNTRGHTIYGVVVEESEVPLIMADGGECRYKVPADRLRFSGKVLRRDMPHAMDVWQVTGFREDLNDGGVQSYSAIITKHGIPVLSASNSGYGAPDRYAPLNGDYAMLQDFSFSVREWLEHLDVSEHEIPDEEHFWITYRGRHAPYGVLAADAVDAYFRPESPPLLNHNDQDLDMSPSGIF